MATDVFRPSVATLLCLVAATAAATAHQSLNVLAVSPVAGKSHWNFMRGILRALTDDGHRVTVFTSYPDGDRDNYTEIDMSDRIQPILTLGTDVVDRELTEHGDLVRFVHRLSRNTCDQVYGHEAFRDGRAGGAGARPVDVVLVEYMASECTAHLSAAVPGAPPLVYVMPPPLITYAERDVLGHHANPAAVSHLLAEHGVPRTFAQRFANAALTCYAALLLEYHRLAEPGPPRPHDVPRPRKPSLVFSNAHYATDPARPLPPSVVPVGGIHLNAPRPIPRDILEFIENSPQGVILFTLGSIVSVSSLPNHTKNAIIEVLGQVPQRVLFKYEDDVMPNMPENMMIKKWFPQRDILLHPNVKLFVSHGGISGVYEAVDAGIPILGFPVFFDQPRNLANLVDAGMAISMHLKSVNKGAFSKAISELINNDKYTQNAKITSERFKDRPMSPAQTVTYWTKYVVRHKGAPHLRYHALNLTWYQYFLLDVLGAVLLFISLVLYVAYLSFKVMKKFLFKFISKSKSD